MRLKLLLGLAFLVLNQLIARADEGDTFISPDRRVTLHLVATEYAGSLLQSGSLELLRDEKKLGRWPMDGFIFNALWSPDGNYVALNNRWANSGDYLWVIATKTATLITNPQYAPVTKPEPGSTKDIFARIAAVFPEYTAGTFNRGTTFAASWDKIGDLHVTSVMTFTAGWIAVFTTYHIIKNKLVQTSEEITRADESYRIYQTPSGTLVFGPRRK